MSLRLAIATLLLHSVPVLLQAQPTPLPWLASVGAEERLADLHTISASADVTVSDGLTYSTNSVYHDPQRAIFHITYPDRILTQGVEGRYLWTFDGTTEQEGSPFVETFVLGHQFHAQILFFDRLRPNLSSPSAGQFEGQDGLVVTSATEGSTAHFYYNPDGLPLGMELMFTEGPSIVFRFEDWRSVDGFTLPFGIWIDDGERQFQYRYTDIRFNAGSLADFRAPAEVLTDEQHLLRLHRVAMDGHLFGETTAMKAFRGDSAVFVSEGEIYEVDRNQSSAMLDRIMANRNYTVYDDLIRPIIKVSEDGTLGWVIAQISARGVRFDTNGDPSGPLSFVSGWISLYEKQDGQWRHAGNVSTFQPGRQ